MTAPTSCLTAFTSFERDERLVTPNEAACAPRPRVDTALIKALARAFRWRRMLDEGVCATIGELAKREKVNRGYMSRVLGLTLLAPDIVEAILDGRQAAEKNSLVAKYGEKMIRSSLETSFLRKLIDEQTSAKARF